jgi:signal transduction histidine kinase
MIDQDTASVLLVDDQPAKLLTYQVILSKLDVRLVTAGSAREALDRLLKADFAVVLIDVCMPELDGFELAALIREHPRFRTTAVIFVSGVHLSDMDRIRGYALGAMDYVPVPVIPEILCAKVKAFVDLYRTTRQLERLNAELEQRVAMRTAELEEAGQRKDEFLAVLAHELRNPLAAIRTASQVIALPDIEPKHRENASGVIQRQVTQLVRLIDDLVDMSRIGRGVISLQRERVDVATMIGQAVESSRPSLDARSHMLTVDVPAGCPAVLGDAARLSQVVGNLLTNAAKFTGPGGQVTLRVTEESGMVVITVTDTGIGIEPAMLSRIFDLFTQVGHSPDDHTAGLGIGLALVRRIVEMHDGQVSASSNGPGTGTEVVVRLPALREMDMLAGPPTYGGDRNGRVPPPSRILIVDDNVDASYVLALLLRGLGHEVETVDSGQEALERGPEFTPKIVLLDLGMPGLDGFETARRIRMEPWGRSLSLVAVTGWGQLRDRHRTREAGFDAHMVKPVSVADLLTVLHDLTVGGSASPLHT